MIIMQSTLKTKRSGATYQAKSYEEKFKAIKDVDSGTKKSVVARNLGIPLYTLSTWLKNREKIEEAVRQNLISGQRKRMRTGTFGDIEEALMKWFRNARKNNLPFNGPLLLSKAKQLADRLEIENFRGSVGWLNRFKVRHGLLFRQISGEEKTVNEVDVLSWKETVLKDILHRFHPADIYNADETALFYRMLPTKSFVERGDVCTGIKQSKERLTLLVACSMSGERLPVLVIGKS